MREGEREGGEEGRKEGNIAPEVREMSSLTPTFPLGLLTLLS